MGRDSLFPLALLVSYGLAFGTAALGTSVPGFDDHPGQLYRLWHVAMRGPAPWAWNPDWWAGYPELQFYPPGFPYAGALLHWASLTTLSVPAAYRALVWIAYLAPGLAVFAALARILRSGWLALPGAFLALTLSAGTTSGVEGGVHIGMLGARLAWAMVPLLLLALVPWIDGENRRIPGSAAPLLAAILLTHPAALPAAITMVALGAVVRPPRLARLGGAVAALVLAVALTGFWTLPLVFRLEHTRALAWGEPPSVGLLQALLALLALLGLWRVRGAGGTRLAVALFPWAMVLVTLVDLLAFEPLGVRFLPANRVADGAWMALILAAGLGWSAGVRHHERLVGLAGVLLVVLAGLRPATVTLWPHAPDWPSLGSVERGLRLGDLWTALREAPPGRVLFVRSAVPLVYGTEWYRPHTHVTALAPVFSGRAIVHGTFTHPSPIAALVYRGDAGRAPITRLTEQLDGRSLFGQSLESLEPATFDRHAERLGISVVVALDEDAPRLRALEDNDAFARRASPPPFLLYVRREAVALPRAVAPNRWIITLTADRDAWISTRTAYYPLWRASVQGTPIETRRGRLGDLEVRLGDGAGDRVVDLAYDAGAPEIWGIVVSVVGGAVGLVVARRRGRAG